MVTQIADLSSLKKPGGRGVLEVIGGCVGVNSCVLRIGEETGCSWLF